MILTLVCPECGSGMDIRPRREGRLAICDICSHQRELSFQVDHEEGIVKECPCCGGKYFYKQKDFNRKIGVLLFILAALLSFWTYGISLIVLYLIDLFLFKRLRDIVICYQCQTIFRGVKNLHEIEDFNHERNDRIIYKSDD